MKNYEKRSLALLGHGKWKSALGHTLLIIGMVLVSLGAFAQTPTNGLYMHKTWIPDPNDATGSKGEIMLETFVTGESIITEAHTPTDIVVVVDQSGSMQDEMSDGTKRIDALKAALRKFVATVQHDADSLKIDHRIAIVGFASAPVSNYTTYSNTELLTPSEKSYQNLQTQDYKDALVYANVNGSVNTVLNTAIGNIDASGGTVMHYGLTMARQILSNRDITTFDPDNDPETHNDQPRTQVVVFFTDGYPGLFSPEKENGSNEMFAEHRYTNYSTSNNTLQICAQTVADEAVNEAKTLKQNGAIVYSVGIFDGASPSADYQTQLKYYSQSGPINYDETNWQNTTQTQRRYYYAPYQYAAERTRTRWSSWGNWGQWSAWEPTDDDIFYWEPATEPTSGNSGDAAANGLLHFISSNYAANEIESQSGTPWAAMTVQPHPAGDHDNGKYLAAQNAETLANIFESIASESGGSSIPMGAGTVVQDVVSPSFQVNFPEGTDPNLVIRAYAPKFTGKTGNLMKFETPTNGTPRLALDDNGVVIEEGPNAGAENRLPDNIVNYNPQTRVLTFTNFNFEEMWCGFRKETGHEDEPHGRKLQMFIPIEIEDGSWGDGIVTNGPLSVIKPDGTTVEDDWMEFNIPTANVLGSVWTEVVVDRPTNFPEITSETQLIEISTPEELAWFISEVNGRHGYLENNTVASHPKLNAKLTADIDMSAHNWVPIGAGYQCAVGTDGETYYIIQEDGQRVKLAYEGTFDGNGHVITGLKNNASKYYKQVNGTHQNVVVFPGMFSTVKGTIKNVFVLDADFRGKQHTPKFKHHGIIADTLATSGKIFNCGAAGRITCNNDPNYADPEHDSELVFGGLVGLNEGLIYNCMAMAELTGYTIGGMVGENKGTFKNGFTNGVYNYLHNGITGKYAGGIAATNTGTIDNCYVRFERANENLDKVTFGQITGSGSFTKAYSPNELDNMVPATSAAGTDKYTKTLPAQWLNRNGQNNLIVSSGKSLEETLEGGKGDYASWMRTTALGYQYSKKGGNINSDYPVLKLDEFTCVGSSDGIRIDYAINMKEMLHRHNLGNMNVNTDMPLDNNDEWYHGSTSFNYGVTNSPAIKSGAIFLYANDDVTLNNREEDATYCSNNDDVVVYIGEDVSLLQDANSTITGFTGQTLKNFDASKGKRWHTISSSLKDSQFGWTYTRQTDDGDNHKDDEGLIHQHSLNTNPCGLSFNQNDDDTEIFPADFINYHHGDFYCFYEPQYHWINFRRHTNCHWHMDNYELNIKYENEDHFIPGKGYLMAINADQNNVSRKDQFIQNRGILNNGNSISIKVSADAPEWTGLKGYNLLGNPYQSYLNFEVFKSVNNSLWNGEEFANTYAVYDPESDAWLQYATASSDGAKVASQYINMHQGFMIRVSEEGNAQFTNAMRTNEGTPNFRGAENHYPLINFFLDNGQDSKNVAVLELGRPENGGAEKLNVGSTKGRISLRHDNTDFGILFRDITEGSQPLYFDTDEDGTFTLSWNTANANFSSLTLVDNLTGVKYDMLANDSYSFQGNANDYRSRFKVVIGRFTDVEENEEVVTDNFAFFDGSDWVVNGQGQLTVTDMTGRTVYTSNLVNDQNRVSLNGVANGIYLMRVANGQNVNVQKIIIK